MLSFVVTLNFSSVPRFASRFLGVTAHAPLVGNLSLGVALPLVARGCRWNAVPRSC